jgi:hypothetical protein
LLYTSEYSARIAWCVVRELTIAPFQLSDKPQLIEVIDSVCADTPWMQTRRFEPTPAWQHALENEACSNHLLALAKLNKRIIGWCRLFPLGADQPKVVELGIGILSLYRHQAIGTLMMKYALEWANLSSVASVALTTHPENIPALLLFRKFKFLERASKNNCLRMDLPFRHFN